MSRNVEKSLLEIDFAALTRGPFTPSPAAWEDQVMYFLMLDRFSDGNERGGYADVSGRPVETGATPRYSAADAEAIDYDAWLRAGGGWQGGTIKGLTGKLGYLRRLGVTTMIVEPRWPGATAGISPPGILLSTVFWTWIWGPVGLLLATPLTVLLVVMGKHIPALRQVYIFLADRHEIGLSRRTSIRL